jgi:hypothetical protein
MVPARRMLLFLLVTLGLLSVLAWEGTALACPSSSAAAAPMVRMHGCDHAPAPAKPRPASHDGQICASLCFGVLLPLAQMEPHVAIAIAPLIDPLQPLSGIDPGLDPPPPRAS